MRAEAERTANFATGFTWFQLCLDDQPYGIAFMFILCLFLILDVLVLVYESTLRGSTIRLHVELVSNPPAELPPVVYHLDPVRNPFFGQRRLEAGRRL